MTFQLTGLPEMIARIAVIQAELLASAGPALHDAVDELITVPSQERVPVATGALRDSARTSPPIVEGSAVTVVSSYGSATDGPPPSAGYAVVVHEDLSRQHPTGEAKWLELTAMENAPQLLGAVAAKMKGGKPM